MLTFHAKAAMLIKHGFHQQNGLFIRAEDHTLLEANAETGMVVRKDKHGRETSPAMPIKWHLM